MNTIVVFADRLSIFSCFMSGFKDVFSFLALIPPLPYPLSFLSFSNSSVRSSTSTYLFPCSTTRYSTSMLLIYNSTLPTSALLSTTSLHPVLFPPYPSLLPTYPPLPLLPSFTSNFASYLLPPLSFTIFNLSLYPLPPPLYLSASALPSTHFPHPISSSNLPFPTSILPSSTSNHSSYFFPNLFYLPPPPLTLPSSISILPT